MMADFQTFLDSVMHVPAEFERNMILLRTLDTRVSESMGSFNGLIKKYKETNSKSVRLRIRKEMDKLEKKLESYSHDKYAVAEQTYRLIDDIVVQMTLLKSQKGEDEEEVAPIIIQMPTVENEPIYCTCRGVSWGEMIQCDNEDCPIEWFHLSCVDLEVAPEGNWYCKDCRDCITIRLPKTAINGAESKPKTTPRLKHKSTPKPKLRGTKRKRLRS